jgi:hypothetical protein
MNKHIPSLILASMVMLQQHAEGWSKNVAPGEQQGQQDLSPEAAKGPDGRKGIFEIDYLFWKPYQDDLIFATKTHDTTSGSVRSLKIRPKTPDFNLGSGVRVGFGAYTSDVWDVTARGTYFYTDGHEEANASNGAQVSPSFFPGFEGGQGTESSGFWRLNFGLIDLAVGRDYALTRKVSFHPFIGVRNAWINQKFKSTSQALVERNTPPNEQGKSKNSFTNDIWGIGPRVGFDLTYYVAKEWSLQGGLSGAFIYGKFSARQKANMDIIPSTTAGVSQLKINAKDSNNLIRSNLDAYFGIGWDRWLRDGRNRVHVALLCETSYWYHVNQYFDVDTGTIGTSPAVTTTNTYKRNGDLAFFGGTLHFQFDF